MNNGFVAVLFTATKFSNSSKEKVNIYILLFFLMLRDIK